MKSSSAFEIPWGAALWRAIALAAAVSCAASAADVEDATPGASKDLEIKFAEALARNLYPDLAADIVAEGRAKWPDAELRWSRIEVDSLLMLGKFEEVEKRVAAEKKKNPKSSAYWSLNLALAGGYYAYGRIDDCKKIYADFQKAMGGNPPADIRLFYIQSMMTYGRILKDEPAEALKVYEGLYAQLKKLPASEKEEWDSSLEMVSKTYAELLIKEADDAGPGKKRAECVKKALAVVKELLWRSDSFVFGPAIAMRAHLEILGASGGKEADGIRRARGIIEEYMPMLRKIHDELKREDPQNEQGFMQFSALPQCRFLLAKLMWDAAQAEMKKPKPAEETVKSLLFGERGANGKRAGDGAYNHALNVFLKYPESNWASDADELCVKIQNLVRDRYKKDLKYNASAAQRTRVRQMQFKAADKLYRSGEYGKAIAAYTKTLSKYQEWPESALAMANMAQCHLELAMDAKDRKGPERAYEVLCAEAIALQLAERICAGGGEAAMKAGDGALAVAGKLDEMKELAASEEIYDAYLATCQNHPSYSLMATTLGFKACADADKIREALDATPEGQEPDPRKAAEAARLYRRGIACLKRVPAGAVNAADSRMRMAQAYLRVGENSAARKTLEAMKTEFAGDRQACLNAGMQLSVMHKSMGLELLKATDETVEKLRAAAGRDGLAAVLPKADDEMLDQIAASVKEGTPAQCLADLHRRGSAQMIMAIKEFGALAGTAANIEADEGVSKTDRRKASTSREYSMFQIGDCWQRMTKPEQRIDMFREKAADAFAAYVEAYPQGTNAPMAYFRMNLLYSMLSGGGDKAKAAGFREKSEAALRQLQTRFPGHELSRKSIPILAKTYLEMNMPQKAVEQYRKMLEASGGYGERDYLDAGETLLSKGVYETARDAFRKARTLAEKSKDAGVREWYVPKCQFGMARSWAGTGNWSEANDAIAEFLDAEEAKKKEAKAQGRRAVESALVKDALELQSELAVRAGSREADDNLRKERFNAAAKALKNLSRRYQPVAIDVLARSKTIAEGRDPGHASPDGGEARLDPSKPEDARRIEEAKAIVEKNNRNKVMRDSIELKMARVIARKWEAEKDMGRTEEAEKTRTNVAMAYANFINENVPDPAAALTEQEEREGLTVEGKIARIVAEKRANEGEMENIESAIAEGIGYLVAEGGDINLELAKRAGKFYAEYFPQGKARSSVEQHYARAKALKPDAPGK